MIYYSDPAISPPRREFNLALTTELEKAGFSVFLPQRDGIDTNKPPYSALSRQERSAAVFEKSRDLIIASDVFLFILDGTAPEAGESYKLGLAYAHRLITGCSRLIIGFQTDGSMFAGARLNPVLFNSLDVIVNKREELFKALTSRAEMKKNRKLG